MGQITPQEIADEWFEGDLEAMYSFMSPENAKTVRETGSVSDAIYNVVLDMLRDGERDDY
jgi:hypothetical protein